MPARFDFGHLGDQRLEICGQRGDLDPAICRSLEHQDDIALRVNGAMQTNVLRLEGEIDRSRPHGYLGTFSGKGVDCERWN